MARKTRLTYKPSYRKPAFGVQKLRSEWLLRIRTGSRDSDVAAVSRYRPLSSFRARYVNSPRREPEISSLSVITIAYAPRASATIPPFGSPLLMMPSRSAKVELIHQLMPTLACLRPRKRSVDSPSRPEPKITGTQG